MKRILPLWLWAAVVLVPSSAFQWPSDPENIVHSFSELREFSVSKGMAFEDPGFIRPFDAGRTIFRYTPDPFSPLPGGENSLLVLAHDNGFQSVYEGLDPRIVSELPERVPRGSLLSGEEETRDYRFYIRDARLRRLVNPLLLLPGLNDRIPPEMAVLRLISAEGTAHRVAQEMVLPAGSYKVYVEVSDRISRGGTLRLMPFHISLYNLGSLQAERKLDTIVQSGRSLSLQPDIPLREAFDDEGALFLGEMVLNSGTASLEVGMEDFFGNERTERFSFTVTR